MDASRGKSDGNSEAHLFVFTGDKVFCWWCAVKENCDSLGGVFEHASVPCQAGMKGVDKEKVNQVIFEIMSKGSKFYENAKRLDARLERCANCLSRPCV